MNANSRSSTPVRRAVRALLVFTGICLAPFAILALVMMSYLSLDAPSATLRRHIMAATAPGWSTKIQLSVGRATIGAVQLGLRLIEDDDIEDARLALSGITRASVGIYERSSAPSESARARVLSDTDQTMEKRGWTRLVGVVDGKNAVIVYVPQNAGTDESVETCLAVINDKYLVVVSTHVKIPVLEELIKIHSSDRMKERWLPKGLLVRD